MLRGRQLSKTKGPGHKFRCPYSCFRTITQLRDNHMKRQHVTVHLVSRDLIRPMRKSQPNEGFVPLIPKQY